MRKFKSPAEMLAAAISIAACAHEEQIDKGGQPYIYHCLEVSNGFKKDEYFERTCAILHDTKEDTYVNDETLRENGFPEDVITVVDLITRKDKQKYADYIINIYDYKKNDYLRKVAIRIKLNDLNHNTDLTRLPVDKDINTTLNRMKKYTATYMFLNARITKENFLNITDNL